MGSRHITAKTFGAILVLLCARSYANEISWIAGNSSPPAWTIEPAQPGDTDLIPFSGPTGVHLSRGLAERAFGGQPTLTVDGQNKTVELWFKPPADNWTSGWELVCGLKGSFGPLEPGAWRFFSNQGQATFSIAFEVTGDAPRRTIRYVDAGAGGTANGSSWADAFIHLQDALEVAPEDSEIRVAQGTYRPDRHGKFVLGDPSASFHLKNGITLRGGYAGASGSNPNERDWVTYETILSGDLYGDDVAPRRLSEVASHSSRKENCYHVVVTSGTDATAVLDGFTISGGMAMHPDPADGRSGGGGIYNDEGSPIIRDCLISGNAARSNGGGLYTRGRSAPTLIGCIIAGNWSESWAGGIYNEASSDLNVSRCIISGNGALYHGGGIGSRFDSKLTMSHCIVSGNMAIEAIWGRGGGLYGSSAAVDLNHCTIVANAAALGPALACDSTKLHGPSDIRLSNCIVWNGVNALWNNDQSFLTVTYSDMQGGWPGAGNIGAKPGFVDQGYWDLGPTVSDRSDDIWFEGDYHLPWNSPCVDAGDPQEVPDAHATDLDGLPRLSGAAVDMGAYETRNDPPVAETGPVATGFTLDGLTGTVTLDGRGSYDPEGRPLTHRWYRSGELVSTEAQFTVELPLGDQIFTLIVSDGVNDSMPAEVVASVLKLIDTWMCLTPAILDRGGGDNPIVAMIRIPERKRQSDVDSSQRLRLYPGGIEATKQTYFPWLSGDTFIICSFDKAKLLKAVPRNGAVALRVVGRLKDGRYFSAEEDTTIR